MRRSPLLLLAAITLALVALGVAAVTTERGTGSVIAGRVVEPRDMTGFPAGSTLVLRLVDRTETGRVVAQESGDLATGWDSPGTHPPVQFELGYAPADIDAAHTYQLTAVVIDREQKEAAAGMSPVLTRGGPTKNVVLLLRKAY